MAARNRNARIVLIRTFWTIYIVIVRQRLRCEVIAASYARVSKRFKFICCPFSPPAWRVVGKSSGTSSIGMGLAPGLWGLAWSGGISPLLLLGRSLSAPRPTLRVSSRLGLARSGLLS